MSPLSSDTTDSVVGDDQPVGTSPSSTSQPEEAPPVIPCPDCGHMVPAPNMVIHQATVHRNAPAPPPSAPSASVPPRPQSTEPQPPSSSEPEEDLRPLPSAPLETFDHPPPTVPTAPSHATLPTVPGRDVPTVEGRDVTIQNGDSNNIEVVPRPATASAASTTTPQGPLPSAGSTLNRWWHDMTDHLPWQQPTTNHRDQPSSTTAPSVAQMPAAPWSCPVCTLDNAANVNVCQACGQTRPETAPTSQSSKSTTPTPYPATRSSNNPPPTTTTASRAPDPVRREQLVPNADMNIDSDWTVVQPPPVARAQRTNVSSAVHSGATTGGVLGSVVNAGAAWMMGRPVASAAVDGAVQGAAVGGLAGLANATNQNMIMEEQARRNVRSNGARNNSQSSRSNRDSGGNVRVFHLPGGGTMTIMSTSSRGGFSNSPNDPFLEMERMLAMQHHAALMQRAAAGGSEVSGMSYEQLLEAFGSGNENMGATESEIRSLPTAVVTEKSDSHLPEEHRQCAICLQGYAAGDIRKTLPCLHGFHEKCVDQWLKTSATCPICKHSIQQNSAEWNEDDSAGADTNATG